MSILSQIAAAIRSALSSVRTVVRRCTRTGRRIFETVRDSVAQIGAVPAAPRAPVPEPVELPPEARWQAIRALAIAMLGDSDGPDHYAAAGERDSAWLSVLSRSGLARIACAADRTIEAHVTGEHTMRGICAADPASVAAMIQAIAIEELKDAERMSERTDELLAAVAGPKMSYA